MVKEKAGLVAVASLLAAALVLRPLAHGVPLGEVVAFWATALGQAVLPGVALARGTGLLDGRDRCLLLGQGATLGIALQGLALLAGRALGVAWLPIFVAVAATALGLALSRRRVASGSPDGSRAPVLVVGVAVVAAVLQPLASAQVPGAPVPFDMLFHTGNAAELRHRWPLEDPRAAGIPLNYHLLAYALPVAAADLGGAPVANSLLGMAPLAWVTLLALQIANSAHLLAVARPEAGALAAALVVLHVDPGALLGLPTGAFNSHLATGVYGSPTTVAGLLLLAGLTIALHGWLAQGGWLRLASLGLLALAASAAKTTVLPIVLAGLVFLGARSLATRRSLELRRTALAFAVVAAAGAPLTLWQTGGEEGYTSIVRIAPASVFTASVFADRFVRWAGSPELTVALAVPGFLLWLLGYLGLAGAAAAVWLAGRREPASALLVFALGGIAAGLALGLTLDVPGMSQLFLTYNGQLLLALLGGPGLAELVRRPRPWGGRQLIVAGVLFLLALPPLGQLVFGQRGALLTDWRAALRRPSGLERDYATGLAWLRAHATRDAVVFADNPSLLLSSLGEVRLFYENGLYTARAWAVEPGTEPWPERVALQERLLRRPDAEALREARRAVGTGARLIVAADAVQSEIRAGIVYAAPGPVPGRRLFPEALFSRPYSSATLHVYEARTPESELTRD